jgi:N-methylhydantoinase B
VLPPADLEVLRQALTAVPEEMGVVLVRSAYSPNIKERRDASCAVFDPRGRMVAQAEHIPVHLGSMPLAVGALLAGGHALEEGDAWVVNDPYAGGSHLPDITVITPVIGGGAPLGFTASKAHHADVGGKSPGSMDPTARTLGEEGLVIPLQRLVRAGEPSGGVWDALEASSRTPVERLGDLRAQLAANSVGAARLRAFVARYGRPTWDTFCDDVIEYSRRRMEAALGRLRPGTYAASDVIEPPGPAPAGHDDVQVPDMGALRIAVELTVGDARATFDLSGTGPEVDAPLNAPYSVTLSAVYYAVRAMTDPAIPPNHGCYLPVEVVCPRGCLLNPTPPHPVSAGNVETSQRVADVCLAALGRAHPDGPLAMSQGTMNNILIGTEGVGAFTFYETLGGGEGGSPWRAGMSGVHTHMTNTANTPVEALEAAYPLRVRRLGLRRGTGGAGRHAGGDGIVKEVELLAERAVLTLVCERRLGGPRGAAGGADGAPGRDALVREGAVIDLPSKCKVALRRGDVVTVETPGGGGWGAP